MRWGVVAIVGLASVGLLAVSVSINFVFGSSFGRTALESYAYGAAFGFGAETVRFLSLLCSCSTSWSRNPRNKLAKLNPLNRILHW